MLTRILTALAATLLSGPIHAAPLTVRVVDSAGRPVSDAVVTVRPSGAAPKRASGSGQFVMAQKGMKFIPFVLVVPVGARVSFPNYDPTKHHVYSFSRAKQFELKLFARDQSRSVRFDKAGVVALGCNIHDMMTAFIFVTDSAWTQKTNSKGLASFGDIPETPAKLSVWHPYLRAPGNSISRGVAAGDRSESFSVVLRPPPKPMTEY
jgi:plastocyanin